MSDRKRYIWSMITAGQIPPCGEDLEVLVESNAHGEEPFYASIRLVKETHDGHQAYVTKFVTPAYSGMEDNFTTGAPDGLGGRWFFNIWRRAHPDTSLCMSADVGIAKIFVADQKSKDEVLKASKYLHDLPGINTDYTIVNQLCHLYLDPDSVTVIRTAAPHPC